MEAESKEVLKKIKHGYERAVGTFFKVGVRCESIKGP